VAESNDSQDKYSLRDLQDQRRKIDRAIQGLKRELAVMFCDVKDSTRYFEEFGDLAGHAMVDQFEVISRKAIEGNDGIVIKKMGDGVMSCFEDPVKAGKAALGMYAALDAHNERADSKMQEIDARAAIHFGLSLVDEDDGQLKDVYGDTVNTTARLQKIASDHGADLVVSKAVAERLVKAQGFDVLDPIEDSAKGKSDPVLACQVVIPGRESARPAPVPATTTSTTTTTTFPRWISVAAAIIVIAVGAFYFTGNNETPEPPEVSTKTMTKLDSDAKAPALNIKKAKPSAAPKEQDVTAADNEPDQPVNQLASYDPNVLEPLAIYPTMIIQREDPKTGEWELVENVDNPIMYEDDQFQFIVVPSSDCYAYVIHFTSQGGTDVIFPDEGDESEEAAKLKGGVATVIPNLGDGVTWWPMDAAPGAEVFFFVASYVPIEDPHGLADSLDRDVREQIRPIAKGESSNQFASLSLSAFDDLEQEALGTLRSGGRSIRERPTRGIKKATTSKVETIKTTLSDGTPVHRLVSLESGSATVVKKFTIRHKARDKKKPAERLKLDKPAA
jgi:class 3 adenylate cyclase